MKVLVIAAHPDDEVYGMGGTIAKLSAEGNEVHVLIVTDGSTTQYKNSPKLKAIINKKKEEVKYANDVLGVTKVHFGELPDMRLDNTDHVEVNSVIENVIREVKPEVVYTHFYGDVNLDHQYVYKSTLVAIRPVPNQSVKELYCYRVPSSTEWAPQTVLDTFMPTVFVDISKYCLKKYEAIKLYETEIRNYPHPRSVEYVEKIDRATGLKCGIGTAEEFMLLRKIIV
jgi:LmbE family N-acetylglucosaminyl deacetylase